MMKEIKFRGKVKYNGNHYDAGDTITGFYHNYGGKCFIKIVEQEFLFSDIVVNLDIEVDCKTVGQYTGLKDKNGVDIFEGDILTGWQHDNKKQFTVVYKISAYTCGFVGECEDRISYIELGYDDLEVIGNIHEAE